MFFLIDLKCLKLKSIEVQRIAHSPQEKVTEISKKQHQEEDPYLTARKAGKTNKAEIGNEANKPKKFEVEKAKDKKEEKGVKDLSMPQRPKGISEKVNN
jgi:hypothetical protein